jgi:hypothetical protein
MLNRFIWSDDWVDMTIFHARVKVDALDFNTEERVSDQAALAGVFKMLYKLHLHLLELKQLIV